MTTKLAGKDTVFLPFNLGNNRHAGNPPNPHGSPTAYLWEQILQRDTWLDILGRFLHLQVTDTVDPVSDKKIRTQTCCSRASTSGRRSPSCRAARPRAGPPVSGPALGRLRQDQLHRLDGASLSVLHDEANKKVFDSVIVVTDRTVLDTSCRRRSARSTAPGVVADITGQGGAKSQELADALTAGTKIIIFTIQTFPFALEPIRTLADLKGKSFAVIADEAHSSQTGEASKRSRRS